MDKCIICTTEKELQKLGGFPDSNIWKQIIKKQKHIIISTISNDNKWDQNNNFLLNLHKSQIDIVPASSIINDLPNNPVSLDYFSDSVMLLDNISIEEANRLSKSYGVCCFSTDSQELPYIATSGWDVDAAIFEEKSWDSFFKGCCRNYTSAIIIDRYLFNNEWNKGDGCPDDSIELCKYNLRCILDNIIPFEIENNKFCVTIIFSTDNNIKSVKLGSDGTQLRDKNNRLLYDYYTFEELVAIISEIVNEIYRDFTYKVEIIGINKKCEYYNETHDRYILTNFFITNVTQKLIAFTPDQKELYKQKMYFNYLYSVGLSGKSTIPALTIERVRNAMWNLIKNTDDYKIKYAVNGQIEEFSVEKIKNKLLIGK